MKLSSRLVSSLSILALGIGLVACGSNTNDTANNTTQNPEGGNPTPSNTATTAAAPPIEVPFKETVTLTGAGASFPAPLYQGWFQLLNQEVPQLQVNYQSVGSGAGVEQFTQKTVDFGASDVAMKDEEIAKVKDGVLMLPMTAGSIVFAYNVPEITGDLKLSREAYVGIMKGDITQWNDPKIAAANPDLKLPDKPITVVHRSDGSGTTAVFTKHLAAVSKDWESTIGQGKTVDWPKKGKFIGAKGNEGITATIQQNPGSIGYVEYGYAKNNNLKMAMIENKAGQYVAPNIESEMATLESVELPADFRAFITDPEGEKSYPLVTYTWILVPKKVSDPNKAIALEAMIQYALTKGQQSSEALGYIPLPANVIEKVAAAADEITPDFTIKVK